MNRVFLSTLVAVLALCSGEAAFAWADRGHQIVGQIAEETIKPTTRDFVRGVLGLEPLSIAAVFPDHVKDDSRFAPSFGEFHYCEIPAGSTYENKKSKIAKDCFGVITGAIGILKDSTAAKGTAAAVEKQIALRYLVHVMGDIGNPLHVGNGLDRGGNDVRVVWQPDGPASALETNLHAVWDDSLIQYLGQTYADPSKNRRAAIYMGDYMKTIREHHRELLSAAGKQQFGAGDLSAWLMESAGLRDQVYPGAFYASAGKTGGSEPARTTASRPNPVLDKSYADKFAPIAELQMVKAGLRLACVLDSIADARMKSKNAPANLTDAEQDAILRSLQEKFRNK